MPFPLSEANGNSMRLNVPHKFTRTEAISRIKNALEAARPQAAGKMDIHEERWDCNILYFDITAEKQRISGTLAVEDSQFVLDAKLPLMMRLFEARIERELAEQIKRAV